jgi:lipooligosaccharide transport system permease protein
MSGIAVSYRALKVWQRNRDVFFHLWLTELSWPIMEPLLVLVGLGLGLGGVVELTGEQDYIQFVTPGVLSAFPMFATMAETGWGAYSRMVTQRTFEATITTPVSLDDVVAGEVLWGASKGLLSTAYILLVALALTPGHDLLQSPFAVLAIPIGFLAGLMFASLALLGTSMVRSLSQLGSLFSLAVLPMFWLAGVFFPLEEAPKGVQIASWFMPLRHVVELQRAAVAGTVELTTLASLVCLIVATLILFRLVLWRMRVRLIR